MASDRQIIRAATALMSDLLDKVAEIRDSQTGATNIQYVKDILDLVDVARKASE